jgi:prepilin-type N-terminal cleavage/methylation domain-containing protein
MSYQRGYSLLELVIATGIVAIICITLVLGFSSTVSLAHAGDAGDVAALEAHNLAVSVRAAIAYDRGAVAAVGSTAGQTYTLAQPAVSVTSSQAGTVLNLQVTAAPSRATVAVPLAQEVPFPNAFVLVNH